MMKTKILKLLPMMLMAFLLMQCADESNEIQEDTVNEERQIELRMSCTNPTPVSPSNPLNSKESWFEADMTASGTIQFQGEICFNFGSCVECFSIFTETAIDCEELWIFVDQVSCCPMWEPKVLYVDLNKLFQGTQFQQDVDLVCNTSRGACDMPTLFTNHPNNYIRYGQNVVTKEKFISGRVCFQFGSNPDCMRCSGFYVPESEYNTNPNNWCKTVVVKVTPPPCCDPSSSWRTRVITVPVDLSRYWPRGFSVATGDQIDFSDWHPDAVNAVNNCF